MVNDAFAILGRTTSIADDRIVADIRAALITFLRKILRRLSRISIGSFTQSENELLRINRLEIPQGIPTYEKRVAGYHNI
jgi:hypothetical protein